MQQSERTYSSGYRFGFGGQEKDDEVKGIGNSYTAEYWQYDSRLGRRWNVDPVVKPWESPYAAFANNPIYFIDPSGADFKSFLRKAWEFIKHPFNKSKRAKYINSGSSTDKSPRNDGVGKGGWGRFRDKLLTAVDNTRIFKPSPPVKFVNEPSYRRFIKRPSDDGIKMGVSMGIKDFDLNLPNDDKKERFIGKPEVEFKGVKIDEKSISLKYIAEVSESENNFEIYEEGGDPLGYYQFVPTTMLQFFQGQKPYNFVQIGTTVTRIVKYKQVIQQVSISTMVKQRELIYRDNILISDMYREGVNLEAGKGIKGIELDAGFSTFGDWKPMPGQ